VECWDVRAEKRDWQQLGAQRCYATDGPCNFENQRNKRSTNNVTTYIFCT
jgi:hypothetical protein